MFRFFRGVCAANPSGLTHLAVASSQRVDAAALAKKLARRFGEEVTEELLLSTVLHVRQRLGLIRRWGEREGGRQREGDACLVHQLSDLEFEQTRMHQVRVAQHKRCPAKQVT